MANSISGNCGLAGATVYTIGALSAGVFTKATVTADGTGAYSLGSLPNGNYQVTPYSPGYTFSPAFSSQTISGSNITGVNFTSTAIGTSGVWAKQGIVLTPTTSDLNGGSPTSGIQEPTVLYENNPQLISANPDGKVFKMWFAGGTHIYYAESNAGTPGSWTRQVAPVFAGQLGNPRVFHNGSTYYLTGTTNTYIGGNIDLYTSATGTSFTLAHSSILTTGSAGQWDAGAIWDFTIVEVVAGVWHALYTASYDAGSQFNSGYATSSDGVTWAKSGSNPVLPNQFSNYVLKIGSTYYAWGSTTVFFGNAYLPFAIPTEGGFASSSDLINWTGTTNILQRTIPSESSAPASGQTGTYGSLVEVSGTVYYYYTTSNIGTDGLGFNVQLATYFGTLAQLVATNQQAMLRTVSPNPFTITFAGSAGGAGSISTLSAPAYNQAAGHTIVVAIRTGAVGKTITSVTDTAGNGPYTPATAISDANFGPFQFFYKTNCLGNTANVVAGNLGQAQTYAAMAVWDISVSAGTILFDTESGITKSNTKAISTPTSSTEASNDAVLFAGTSFNVNDSYSGSSLQGTTTSDPTFPLGSGNLYCGAAHTILSNQVANLIVTLTQTGAANPMLIDSISMKSSLAGIFGMAIAGATISWTGPSSGSTTADGSGNYGTSNLDAGTYTITPSLSGYTFSPTNISVTVGGVNITGVNFTATPSGGGGSAWWFLGGPGSDLEDTPRRRGY